MRAGTKHIVEATSQSPRAVYSSHEEKPLLEHHVLAVLDFIHFYYIYIYIFIFIPLAVPGNFLLCKI